MHHLPAVAGLACALAAAAHAEVNSRIDVQVSHDGVNFSSALAAVPGNIIQVRVQVTYTGSQSPIGMSSIVFQPTVSRWQAGDTLLPFVNNGVGGQSTTPIGAITDNAGQYGRIIPWATVATAQTNAIRGFVHASGAIPPDGPYLRIAQAHVTSWIGAAGNTSGGSGVNCYQLSNIGRNISTPPFNPSLTTISVFRFGLLLNSTDPRTLTVDIPIAGMGNYDATTGERRVHWYASLLEPTGSIRGAAIVNPAQIHYVPAPATLLLLLPALRRRRP